MRTLIDANVILRYLLDDNKEMADKADVTIQKGACTIPEVLAEVVYVLKGVYNMKRDEIADCILGIVEIVEMEHSKVMIEAIGIYKEKNLDFVDCILIAFNHVEEYKVFSFDKKSNRELYLN